MLGSASGRCVFFPHFVGRLSVLTWSLCVQTWGICPPACFAEKAGAARRILRRCFHPSSAVPGFLGSGPRRMPTALRRGQLALGPFGLTGPRAASQDTQVCSGETYRLVNLPPHSCFTRVNTGTSEGVESPAGWSLAGQVDGRLQ